MSTEETSGGSYKRQVISFNSIPNATMTDMVLSDGSRVQMHLRLDDNGEWMPVHRCQVPVDPSPNDDQNWTCPECQNRYELHSEAWYVPEGE